MEKVQEQSGSRGSPDRGQGQSPLSGLGEVQSTLRTPVRLVEDVQKGSLVKFTVQVSTANGHKPLANCLHPIPKGLGTWLGVPTEPADTSLAFSSLSLPFE